MPLARPLWWIWRIWQRQALHPGTIQHRWQAHVSFWQFPHGRCQRTQPAHPTVRDNQRALTTNKKCIPTPARITPATHQTQQYQPNWHSINDNNNNANTPETDTNIFYTQWGDTMHPTKWPKPVRLALQNFSRWLQWNNNKKIRAIWQFLNEKHIDIFLTIENNVAWHCIPAT